MPGYTQKYFFYHKKICGILQISFFIMGLHIFYFSMRIVSSTIFFICSLSKLISLLFITILTVLPLNFSYNQFATTPAATLLQKVNVRLIISGRPSDKRIVIPL